MVSFWRHIFYKTNETNLDVFLTVFYREILKNICGFN